LKRPIAQRPSPRKPATGHLAALSVLTLLKDLDDPLQAGT
jgi:predicted dinucleotide-utilizing enzyme